MSLSEILLWLIAILSNYCGFEFLKLIISELCRLTMWILTQCTATARDAVVWTDPELWMLRVLETTPFPCIIWPVISVLITTLHHKFKELFICYFKFRCLKCRDSFFYIQVVISKILFKDEMKNKKSNYLHSTLPYSLSHPNDGKS